MWLTSSVKSQQLFAHTATQTYNVFARAYVPCHHKPSRAFISFEWLNACAQYARRCSQRAGHAPQSGSTAECHAKSFAVVLSL